MSGSTFSAPTGGPTAGLQAYNLERGVKQLYPATIAGFMGRLQIVAARRRRTPRGALKKGIDMPIETLKDLIATLSQSVTEILEKGTPEERDALLKQSFAEFTAVVEGEVETLAKAAPGFDDLFKGLGCVGRVANLAQHLASQVRNIQDGRDYRGPMSMSGGDEPDGDDPASSEVVTILNAMVQMSELALRAAVNEHVDLHDDGDDVPDGFRLVTVPTAEDPSDPQLAVVVKTYLPEGLAKYATDPALLQDELLDIGLASLVMAGVRPATLEKALGIEGLAKAFPPSQDGEDDEEDAAEGDEEAVAEGEEGDDPENDPEEGGEDEAADSPFDVAGRLAAALMIQIAHMQQMFDGDGEAETDPGEAETDPDEAETDPAARPFGKVERDAGLAKGAVDARVDELQAQVAELTGQMRKMADLPGPAKGVTMAVVGTSKERDGLMKVDESFDDQKDTKGPDGYSENDLEKLDPDRRALVLMKRAQRRG